jgi:NAD(P) transhydrogenase subunit beta
VSVQTIDIVYLVSAALFIFSLKWMSDPKTARQAVFAGVAAMTLAVVGTLLRQDIVSYQWIAIAFVLGCIVGVPLSWVPLTAVPQRTALSHAFGGLAAGLVGVGKYYLFLHDGDLTSFRTGAIVFEVMFGFLTCTGSLVAAGKLQEVLPTRPVTYPGQNVVNFGLMGAGVPADKLGDSNGKLVEV